MNTIAGPAGSVHAVRRTDQTAQQKRGACPDRVSVGKTEAILHIPTDLGSRGQPRNGVHRRPAGSSYQKIASEYPSYAPSEWLFLSDNVKEGGGDGNGSWYAEHRCPEIEVSGTSPMGAPSFFFFFSSSTSIPRRNKTVQKRKGIAEVRR
jgi:hypothetical protein